ncbi:type II toxin-antitoxin system RelE/ParE family toxin [Microbispora sp. ZYX-F-249]|uniref:Type II toxin-antitoxin system RelE/ParE family toxin n=1 Tax=Microbispora maris TaxID=3144104 RepID=A0ABV0AG79_9ACTN
MASVFPRDPAPTCAAAGSAAPFQRGRRRIVFVADPDREAILLVAGDKAGRWSGWYHEAIPPAKHRYAQYRADMAKEDRDEPCP